jgi:sugar phosphate isomerase/epimerase
MKYSYMSFSTQSLDLAGMLEVAERYGYDGIEPRLDAKHIHGIEVDASQEYRDAVKVQVEATGIELACLATSLTYADPGETDSMIAQTHERIDLAGDLGVKTMRVFGGVIPEGIDREQAIDLLAESLSCVADHAEDRGVILCIETHDDWCDPAHVATVMTRVNRPSIAVNWDIMHSVRTGVATIEESFEVLRLWIRHVHIHDGIGTGVQFAPIGTGDIDHRRALELLSSAGFAGYLSGEWIGWEAHDIHLPRELATMKRYERELS